MTVYEPATICILRNSDEIGRHAAEHIVCKVKTFKDAVIILPTGSTPVPMYKHLLEIFERDRSCDLSKVTFFNLDEYIGLEDGHPLSYRYYMDKLFYEKLDAIDKSRAPKAASRNVPKTEHGKSLKEAAKRYDKMLAEAVKKTGRNAADLVVLGIGGAYPVFGSGHKFICLKGGHIGFNEPGSKITDRTKIVTLTEKTRLDTSFRFQNLRFCRYLYDRDFTYITPKQAITLGIANILEGAEILLLANLEEKSPVIKEAYFNNPNPDFPASFLKYHPNVHWMIDQDAAGRLPHSYKPWQIDHNFHWDREKIRHAIIEVLKVNKRLPLKEMKIKDLEKAGINIDVIKKFGGIEKIKRDMSEFLDPFINVSGKRDLLPRNSNVVVFSPHPDDDVIDMAATIKTLVDRNNMIWIVYMVNGENAVRNNDARTQAALKEYQKRNKSAYQGKKIPEAAEKEMLRRARIEVRKSESISAAAQLGIPENRLVFLDLPYYYQRGLVDVAPIKQERDIGPVRSLLMQVKPAAIFYSAEADPHGAHGLCTEIISRALDGFLSFWNVTFWGYRGAYEEWKLHKPEDLVIVPFGQKEMDDKIKAIKCHKSQLNPVFPSFDCREFYERARDRNAETGSLLTRMGYLSSKTKNFAEVFRRISHSKFITTK